MKTSVLTPILERQLLLQLGDRLRQLRRSQGMGTVELATHVGISRNTLRAVETGDPATAIGTYLRVMSALGVAGELALLASDALVPAPTGSAGARSRRPAPVIEVHVSADQSRHQLQDLQSLALHEEAIQALKSDPTLVEAARNTVSRWLETGDARSSGLWREWLHILETRAWRRVLGRSQHAQQLRQTSPLATLLPDATRRRILGDAGQLRKGVRLGGALMPHRDTTDPAKRA
jgi:transcriptional regulator with XRE-family HTH domain